MSTAISRYFSLGMLRFVVVHPEVDEDVGEIVICLLLEFLRGIAQFVRNVIYWFRAFNIVGVGVRVGVRLSKLRRRRRLMRLLKRKRMLSVLREVICLIFNC